jgi:hypothetical protein
LHLGGRGIERQVASALAESSLVALRRLELEGTSLGEADLGALLSSAVLARLDELQDGRSFHFPAALLDLFTAAPGRWRALKLPVSCNRAMVARLGECRNLGQLSLTLADGGTLTLPRWPALEDLELELRPEYPRRPIVLAPDTPWPATLRRLSLLTPGLGEPRLWQSLSAILEGLPPGVVSVRSLGTARGHRSPPTAKEVRHLNRLAGLSIGDEVLRGLDDGVDLSELRTLFLWGQHHKPACLARLLRSPTLRRLRSLNLAGPQVTTEVVRAVVESPHLVRLRELDLQGRLGGECFRLLAGWPGLARLDLLMLVEHNPKMPGEEAVAALAHSRYLTRLTRLVLSPLRLVPDTLRPDFSERLGWRARC